MSMRKAYGFAPFAEAVVEAMEELMERARKTGSELDTHGTVELEGVWDYDEDGRVRLGGRADIAGTPVSGSAGIERGKTTEGLKTIRATLHVRVIQRGNP